MTPNANNPRRHLQDLRRPLALAVALALAPFASPVLAQELPRAGNVVGGAAIISNKLEQATPVAIGESTTITQTTKGAIINWGSFDIGATNTVTFDHQVAGGITLNRVIGFAGGPTASNILGKLNSPNGSVFLVNPAGIVFGGFAQVNVGGLVASTLDISDADFNAGVNSGHYIFGPGTGTGHVENDGVITTSTNGTVALLGSQATNDGTITASQGTIALGAGNQITLDIGGDGLTQLTINVGANDANGVSVTNSAVGKLVADGGQVLMQAVKLGPGSFASIVNSGLVQARSLQSRGGRIVLSSSADDNNDSVTVSGGTLDASGSNAGVGGGSIAIDGYDVTVEDRLEPCEFVPCVTPLSVLNASGTTGGGTIGLNARDVAVIDPTSTFEADASGNGNGGSIAVNGTNGLYGYGSYFARGGAGGGNGGSIETSGGGLDLNRIKVDASAPNGTAGQWTIDPYDVTIVHGNAAGTLPTNPFVPLTNSTIQDGDVNNALNGGTSVTIGTGTGGPPDAGAVTIDGSVVDPATGLPLPVDIVRSTGNAPLTFRLDANAGIGGNNFTIRSTSGLLNVIFDSDANGGNAGNGNMAFDNASILTNGGNLSMYGQNDPVNGFATSQLYGGILLNAVTLDTRVGGSDANAGGNILLRGSGSCVRFCLDNAAVALIGSNLYSSTGTIQIDGQNILARGTGSGVALDSDNDGGSGSVLGSTSGTITVSGIGGGTDGSIGLYFGDADVHSIGGDIDLRGHGAADGNNFNDGLDIATTATVTSTSGTTLLSGSSDGSGAGINLASGAAIDAGSGNIVIRAHNNGSTDALVLDGTIGTTGTADLRPGSVDAAGLLVETPNDVIGLGGTTGFGLSAVELDSISAATLVLGSSIQAGAINVLAPAIYGHNLTLQSAAGITINSALNVGANTLALIGAGNITQTAPITAKSLLVQSSGGSVILGNAGNNVSSATLAGSAAGDFTFINAGTIGIGNVGATGFGAAGNTPTVLSGSGVSGNNVLVRALTGNMILNANVSGGNVDLVSSGIFDNTSGSAISATGNWQVWGNSWVGETRGGVAGNGNLPNLYGCAFNGVCGVTPSGSANQFIYVTQPTATIGMGSSTREYGLPNTAIGYAVGGMILGDLAANAINGAVTTSATQASHVGNYAIGGTFTSPAGYLVQVVPGVLAITPATLTYLANPYSRIYGDPNGALGGAVSGFRLTDTQANSTSGALAFTTGATQTSNVGTYAINGGGLNATDYVFVQAAGNANAFAITPATLTYAANPGSRRVGVPNGAFGGSVSGFRNDDTQASSTTGTLTFQSPADTNSPIGRYAIDGSGLSANNYVFTQASGNAVALTILPPLGTYTLDVVRDTPVTYVYDRNFGIVGLCPATDLAANSRDKDGDTLAREWSRVRSRPNLANCVSTKQKNSCGDF